MQGRLIVPLVASLVVVPLLVGATWFALCVVVCGAVSDALYRAASYLYLKSDTFMDNKYTTDEPQAHALAVAKPSPRARNKKFDLRVLQPASSPQVSPVLSSIHSIHSMHSMHSKTDTNSHTYNIARSLETRI